MAIRNLRFEGDPILRKTSKEVKEIETATKKVKKETAVKKNTKKTK